MNKTKFEIPIWAKLDKPIWLEGYDKTNTEVIEYFDGTICALNEAGGELKVKMLSTNEEKIIKSNILLERNPLPTIVNDLADIVILNDAELLKHLELRFRKNLIHSYCGPTLLILNPYKRVEHEMSDETREEILAHLKNRTLAKSKPHIWTISSIAFEFMWEQKQNQAICISGESGSGKTESTKRCLEFITQMKSSSKSLVKVSIEDQILRCNPLLECLGNAKTQVNDNSSRFGKYSILYIDKIKKNVRGASIQNYLLEKSRVTNLGKDERTYHIFYCMCRFMSKDMQKKYLLFNDGETCNMEKFNYLSKSNLYVTPKINDEEFNTDVMNSLGFLEFASNEQDAFWRILSAVLNIGNMVVDVSTFVQGAKGCSIVNNNAFKNVCTLLGINKEAFEKGLTHKIIKIGKDINWSPFPPEKVKTTIDTLSRELYNRLFNWIVKRLNKTLFPKSFDQANYLTIGILDIFGFEIFKMNSLEQLFINFANERLQGLYIDYIFKNECKIFTEEGLGEYTSLIVYKDNKPVIDTLEFARLPPGVFDLLDQMSNTNKTDKEFYNEVRRNHKQGILYYPNIVKDEKDYNFSVKHTARDVQYFTLDFVEKNTEDLQAALKEAINTCEDNVLGIFNETLCLPGEESVDAGIIGGKKQTLSVKFRKSMDELIKQLASCNCHFVRCLKPNELKKSEFWNPLLVLQQIRYMGLLDSLKIRKNSFPFRYLYESFFEVFQDLDVSANGNRLFRELVKEGSDFKSMSVSLLKTCGIEFTINDLLYGKTKIFLNERLKIDLEKALLAQQKQKKLSLALINQTYKTYLLKLSVRKEVMRLGNVISLSRDFLCSWGAKAEAMKFKRFLYYIKRIQLRFRRVVQKRQNRLKSFNMLMIIKHLNLYKFSVKVQYLFYFKNKIKMLSEMLDRKMKESKIRFCRSIVEQCFSKTWNQLMGNREKEVASTIQRTFRAHLLRMNKKSDIAIFRKKVIESKTNNAAKMIQKIARGFLVRRRFERLIAAANKIKSFFRTKWLRSYFCKIRAATKIIQRNLKKYLIRKDKIDSSMAEFTKTYGTLVNSVRQLEYSIMFGEFDHPANLSNVEDFMRMPFYEHNTIPDFGKSNYKMFLPTSSKLDNQVKLFALPIDLNIHLDSTNIYTRTWACEFVKMMGQISKKNQNLIHVEVGETFTIAITDENEFYSWGLNDFGQCGFKTKRKSKQGIPIAGNDGFFSDQKKHKNLGSITIRGISGSKDQGFIIDEGNNLFGWGKCDEKQLGCKLKNQNGVYLLNNFPVSIKGIVTKETQNYALGVDGKTYQWNSRSFERINAMKTQQRKIDDTYAISDNNGNQNDSERNYIQLMNFGDSIKIAFISVGTDFSLFLTDHGHIYSCGKNEFGQLGHGHNENIIKPEMIQDFKSKNEKIIEVSAGNKHFIVITSVSNVYTCGYNKCGQLGTNDTKNRNIPFPIRMNFPKIETVSPLKVQAGVTFSMVLFNNKQVWFIGNCGSQKLGEQSNVLTRLVYETKVA